MAGKQTSSKKEIHTRRAEQLEQMQAAIETLKARIKQYQDKLKQVAVLDSVSRGLYEEIDKLSRKAPAEALTDLALSQANDVIRETKQLLDEDPYVTRLNEFVPAGDNPEHRDAVVVLRQIRQGLERSHGYFKSVIDLLKGRLIEASAVELALELNHEDGADVSKDDLEENGIPVSNSALSGWLVWNGEEQADLFSFTRLDRTNLQEYFADAK